MSLLAAMLYQTKPDFEGRIYKHKLKDDDDEVYHVNAMDCYGVQRGIAIRAQMLVMLKKHNRVTAELAKAMQITSRAALRHLATLEYEGRVGKTTVLGSNQNEWFIKI